MSRPAFALRRSTGLTAVLIVPLIAGLLTGCGSVPAKNDTFDLSAAAVVDGRAARHRQILVTEPMALKSLDSEQIVVRVSPSEIQYLSNSQWGDRLPRMVQSKLVEAFENTGKLGGVGKPGQGLAIDYQIVTEIRAFEVETGGANRATVEIFAKILNDRNGSVKAQKVFQASVPVSSGAQNSAFVRALDAAFARVTGEIIDWTLKSL